MAFFGIGAALAGIVGGGAFFAGVIDFAVTMAVSVGLSYAAAALQGKPATAAAASFSVQGSLQADGAVPRSFNLGYSSTAGSLVYANTWGNDGETPNAYVTQVIAIADLPGGTLLETWVNGELCTLGADTGTGMGLPVTQYNKDGKDHLWIKYYDGTQTTADPFLVDKVWSPERPYQSTRVGVGIAYVICTALVNDTLFTGFPSFKFAVSGIPLYDPTKDSTNGGSGSHRFSDPSTWGGDGDNLPAVQAYNILRGIRYNDAWFYGLQQTVQANLPSVNWNAQIAKCRDPIAAAGGFEPMYRSGGQIVVSSQPADALDALMTTCQGKLAEVGGFYKVHLGTPDSPTFAFTDADILSTEEQTYDPFLTLAESINGITGTYPDPVQGWNNTSAPQFDVPAEYIRDGNRHLLANPAFDFAPYREQVQRLLRSALYAALRERKHVVTMPPVFWLVEPGDVGTWTSIRNGYVDKQFIVDGLVDRANLDVTLSLQEVDPSDYNWNHDTDYLPGTSGPTSFPHPEPQGVRAWDAEAVSILDADGYKRRPAIRLLWDGDMPGVTGIRYQVRRKDDTSPVTSGNTLELSAGAIIITNSLLPDNEYQVAGQYIPSAPRDMLWSDWITVRTLNVKFTVLDFEAALRAEINELNQRVQDVESANLALITSISDNQDAADWLSRDQIRTQQKAVSGTLSASITHVATVAASDTAALAETVDTVSAAVDGNTAAITTTQAAVATITGQLAVSYSVKLDVNGYIIGYQQTNGGPGTGTTIFTTDFFQIVGTGTSPKKPFTVGTVNGVTSIGINADNVLIDASVKVSKLSVATLTAITAAFGDATVSGTLSGATGRMVMSFTGDNLLVSD